MANTIQVECHEKFRILYDLPKGTNLVICIGGRAGMKTYSVSQWIAFQATINKKRTVILRDEKALIRESILNEVMLRYETANEFGVLDQYYEMMENGLRDRKTGEMLVITKGFRASDNTKTANLKSLSNIDIAVIEEGEDIRISERYNILVDGVRNEGSMIVIMMNVPDIQHFIIKRYFNLEMVEDGYFKLIPKKINGFVCIQTSFKDNPHLPEHVVNNYNDYGNSQSHLYNPHYYKTAILGYASSGRTGQILTKVKTIKQQQYMALPFKEIYGQDFGTASPAGFVGVKFDKSNCYCREINYLPKDTLSIGRMYASMKLNARDKIIGDSAEPETIKRLRQGWKPSELNIDDQGMYPELMKGFFIEGCIKGPGSIKTGIGLMTSMNLFAVEESTNLWNEINNWVYAVDKNGQPTDEPVPEYDHCIDPWRYVVTDYKGIFKSNLQNQLGFLR